MKLTAAGRTDVGRQRDHNEDSMRIFREQRLYVVADGVGGAAAGELASQIAVETLTEFYRATAEDPEITWPYPADEGVDFEASRLATGIKLGNQRICQAAARDAKLRGMGSTIAVMRFTDTGAFVAHVGDSRVYRLRQGQLKRLTQDHSLAQELKNRGQLTTAEMPAFRYKNVILRAMGMGDELEVDVSPVEVQPGDVFLLCSDGVTDMLDDGTLVATLRGGRDDLEAACARLVDGANAAGGKDNITALLVRCDAL